MLDLDQQDIELLVDELTDESFAQAQEIYSNGKHSDGYSLQGFSINNNIQMKVNGTGSYYETFQKFVDYYGAFDYADQLIGAAYNKTSVELNGKSFDFSNYSFVGRAGTYELSAEDCHGQKRRLTSCN
jgi:hypothetical protein